MEIQAADAERASIRYKQVEYIKDFVGESFMGVISGVTEWGMYVEITEYKCEGMVRLANLQDDYYEYDEQNQWIIGRRSRQKYQLGDQVHVVVKGADVIKRQVDLDLVSNALVVKVKKSFARNEKRNQHKKQGGKKPKRRR
jgi:ribonuclease R